MLKWEMVFWETVRNIFHEQMDQCEYQMTDQLTSKWHDMWLKNYKMQRISQLKNNHKSGTNNFDFFAVTLKQYQESQPT